MLKGFLLIVLFSVATYSNAQISFIKMVGNNTSDYKLGAGLYLKAAYPVSDGADATIELGGYIFSLNDASYREGTVIAPIKLGYRYTLNGNGSGFYLEPQMGYNLYGSTTKIVNGYAKDFKFNGIVMAGGVGYIFPAKSSPLDLNMHYETIMDKGGSDNYISLGLTVGINLKKR